MFDSPTRTSRLLRPLLIAHGVVTLAAAVVLAVFPSAIPATVGIPVGADGFLLCYFLAAAELAIAMLSIGASRLKDAAAVRLVIDAFIVFHLSTALLEVVYLVQTGPSPVLVANVVVRVVVSVLFFAARRPLGTAVASAERPSV